MLENIRIDSVQEHKMPHLCIVRASSALFLCNELKPNCNQTKFNKLFT